MKELEMKQYAIASAKKGLPALGLGTWRSPPGEVANACVSLSVLHGYVVSEMMHNSVKVAIQSGYRHIDAAWIYKNESEVGQGIRDAGVARNELWITSKLWNTFHKPELVEGTLRQTLKELDCQYLDLYLMHWPVAFQVTDPHDPSPLPKGPDGKILIDNELTENLLTTWRAMESMVEKGLTKHIGLSNFNIRKTKQILAGARIKPIVNQVELNFNCPQPELLKWSKENNILLQSYSPLGSKGASQREVPIIKEIAQKHNVDPANILISWQIARGCVVLPKSVTPSRIKANAQIVELSQSEVDAIEKAATAKPQKRNAPTTWGVDIFEDKDTSKL